MSALTLLSHSLSAVQPRSSRPRALTAERGAAVIFLAGLLALRVWTALHYRVDSDEPQHLHIVWGWANGLLQYRDLFDNHSPLFQMLCAPLFHALGERADIIVPMRLAMIPLFFLSFWCIYKIGAHLADARAGWIAALLAAFAPTFFFVTTEFRTDDLWTALWLVAVLIISRGEFRGARAFCFGLTIGAAVATSMKTSLLVTSLALAAFTVLGMQWCFGQRPDFLKITQGLALALAGALLVPCALVAFFALKGALPQMYSCVVQHNALPGLGKWRKIGFHQFIFPLCVPPLLALAWLFLRSSADRAVATRRAIYFLTAGFYLTLLRSYWPLVTAQDYVPILPVFAVAFAPGIVWLGERAARFHPLLRYALPGLLLAFEIFRCYRVCPPQTNDIAPFNQHLGDLLRLVDRDQFIMDPKGETIFRNRPYYYVLEGVTIERIRRGLIPDDLPQTLIRTATNVVRPRRMTPADYAFIRNNYVEVFDHEVVAGQMLGKAPFAHPVSFTTLWPARYAVVSEKGEISARLDGQPVDAAKMLPAGAHALEITGGSSRVALVWAQAVERGFSPFNKRK